MRNLIEIILEEKTKGHLTSILYSQWEFDKKIIPNALQAISAVFPHYSLHNESHSEAIISNFIKILGESVIRELSATDLWLLLEAAYCHDLGMVVTAEMATEAIISGSILKHFQIIQADSTHELHFCTKDLMIENEKIVFVDNALCLANTDIVKYLLADYFRKQHGTNVASCIINPHSSISLSSPRAIIPNRLYELLAEICESHTKDFDAVMKLPDIEDGIDIEFAHPRFIASLLRLGDLLDIDNGRFSETLLRTLSLIPNSTYTHKDKHMSIKRKSINTKEITIIAECVDKDVAHVTQQWFNWIEEEFTVQTLSWNELVPSHINTFLPSIKRLDVNLVGYRQVNPREKPVFTVDTPKALELLQGANFYETPLKAIRELLQNAIDATLVRIWELHKSDLQTISDLMRIARNYEIEIIIADNKDGYTDLIIKDQGTGISRTDLKFLSSTGSSTKNLDRKKIIAEIPEWMQPVGFFGIGFQSSFLLTDLVEIQTHSMYDNEAYIVELHSPQSRYKGGIYIKNIPDNIKYFNYGTKLSFRIDNKKILVSDSLVSNISEFSDDFTAAYFGILEELREIALFSFIPIIINGEKIERYKFDFISSNNIEFKILSPNDMTSFYFKNIKTDGIYIKGFNGMINYHIGDSSVLDLSRSSVNKKSDQIIIDRCIGGLKELCDDLLRSGRGLFFEIACLYINTSDLELKSKIRDQILSVKVFPVTTNDEDQYVSISELLLKEKVTIIKKGVFGKFSITVKTNEVIIETADYVSYILWDILIDELSSYPYIRIVDFYETKDLVGVYYEVKIEFSNKEMPDISLLSLDKIKNAISYFKKQQKFVFLFIPMLDGYEQLGITYINTEAYDFVLNSQIPSILGILFPIYKINTTQWKDGRNEKFYKWVETHLKDEKLNRSEIIVLYDRLICDCRNSGFDVID